MKPFSFLILLLLLPTWIWAESASSGNKTTPTKKAANYHIYLTFDDGPIEQSQELNEFARSHKLKLNIFVVGSRIASVPLLSEIMLQYEKNPYIQVSNNSYSHAHDEYRNYYREPERVYRDFLLNEQSLNLKNRIARLPDRNSWRLSNIFTTDVPSSKASADLLASHGFSVIGWDLEWRQNPRTSAPVQTIDDMVYLIEKMLAEWKTVTRDHMVILCHDGILSNGWESSALHELLERLNATGNYTFHHLSEYPGLVTRPATADVPGSAPSR